MDRLILDTTYLLPVFGVDVGLEDFREVFPKLLSRYSVAYNPISIVEAKWIILRLSRRTPSQRELLLKAYRRGLRALLSDERLEQTPLTNHGIEEIADQLLTRAGIKDYFDRMIYAAAAHLHALLLTEDEDLRACAEKDLPKPKKTLSWKELNL